MPRLTPLSLRLAVDRIVSTGLHRGSQATFGTAKVFEEGTFEQLDVLRQQARREGLEAVFLDAVEVIGKELDVWIPTK